MKIYEVYPEYEKYDICIVDTEAECTGCNLDNYDPMFHFDGSSKAAGWQPRTLIRSKNKIAMGDYVSCLEGGVMILEENAAAKLEAVMGRVEKLPLNCNFGDYLAINIMDVLACIDYGNSKFLLASEESTDGRPNIMYFEKYAFLKEKLNGFHAFKIVDDRESSIFVDETFVESVAAQGVTGFKFELVWQD